MLGDLDLEGLRRTEAFYKDLETFYGPAVWKEKLNEMRQTDPVKNYILHLENIENENPYLLSAYIYHLYMGLLSGGQILSAKRRLTRQTGKENSEGEQIFRLKEPHTVGSLKKQMRETMEAMAQHFDNQTQEEVLDEGIKVFELNNTLVNSVKGVDEALWRLIMWFLIGACIVVLLSYLLGKWLL